ncbi:MAG: hypothetical protein HQL04_00070 [Nitrospirae bacterium]|nr:hypothetical protein [Nitrospirota bacterium]
MKSVDGMRLFKLEDNGKDAIAKLIIEMQECAQNAPTTLGDWRKTRAINRGLTS